MKYRDSLIIAFATYTRIPMPRAEWNDENRRFAMCFFPLAGAVTGLIVCAWVLICRWLHIPSIIQGAVCAALPILITGGIHMDGFMDTQDAMASWQPMEKRLEILKDTHTGAFAVIYCALYLILNAAFASALDISCLPAVICVYTVSRALSAYALTGFRSVRPGGMLDGFARTAQKQSVAKACAVYIGACVMIMLVSDIVTALLCAAACTGSMYFYRHRAYKYFGGITGDLAGWFLQTTELAMLAAVIIGRLI